MFKTRAILLQKMHPCERAGRGATPTLTPRGMILYLALTVSLTDRHMARPPTYTHAPSPQTVRSGKAAGLYTHTSPNKWHTQMDYCYASRSACDMAHASI